MDNAIPSAAYWSRPVADVSVELKATMAGLSSDEARSRLMRDGRNSLSSEGGATPLQVFARQFYSPLVLILIFAAIVSAFVGEGHEALIIGVIVLASCALSFSQEYSASRAMETLKKRISSKATILRDGVETTIPTEEIVPGDILRLSAGSLIPADGVIAEARDFNVSEAALTGETFPVVKSPGQVASDAGLSARSNVVFTGTSVRSGTATVLVVKTGNRTEFAGIAASIQRKTPETEFAAGIRRFGYLMTQIMLVIVVLVFVANLLLDKPLIDSLLFSLALAVGLTPELLPAIISVTLSRGARTLAGNGVIVRRLEAIENLGSMDILCTDKTGTLTEGVIHLDGCFGADGEASADVTLWARLNAVLQTGLKNPLDEAIAVSCAGNDDLAGYAKVDEIPYDFVRKSLSVVVRDGTAGQDDLMICKGAVHNVSAACTSVLTTAGPAPLDDERRIALEERFKAWSAEGYRVLALAIRHIPRRPSYSRSDEADLAFAGFLLFLDPPKPGMAETLRAMSARGIGVKVITGDNRYVAQHLAATVGLKTHGMITGEELSHMTKEALFGLAPKTDLFVEIDPNQKERIIAALRQRGHAVGYLGDGINDAPALHTADIGISVESAVDVAREAADMILLQRDLGVLLTGIDDSRKTFANTMKYISITTSASFGNMISMAFASLFLPFLPLLAKQILLNNFLSDLPSLAIASDNVDDDQTKSPKHWDIGYIRRFMLIFGLVSTVFDFITFGFLLGVVQAAPGTFQTAWFVESLITELAIVFIIRTRKAFWRSRPGSLLAWLSLATLLLAVAIPYLPFADWFGFSPLSPFVMGGILVITVLYLLASEATKHWFFKRESRRAPVREIAHV
ncbi:magnesium-translocating P-type ATPase [Hansschlegelia plantiphila]|uniref:Magnesium-transporting ATPase, P-type 1 n=1 Tax=Hansschlegelia plantiphila TaxID=374655 RepID=A0A9W6IY86_9HYPH|nr:magnesium-translocating P-type ATPase [Hansschlegelia plantiphila]GLK67336.1 magnesium-translocating P-type ATPase [Hansschlegelia plantiphila]